MMTTIGKALAFVNLLIGMAMLAWSVSVYAQRPSWLDPKPEGAAPNAASIAQFKDDIDNLGRAAIAASANWGAQRKRLEDVEKLRVERQKGYAERLQWARTGNPKDANGAAFFAPTYDPQTG